MATFENKRHPKDDPPGVHPSASRIKHVRIIDPSAPPGAPTSLEIIDSGNGRTTIVKHW